MAIEKLRARRIPFLVINLCSSFSSLFICLFIIKELAQMSGKENLFQALGLAVYLGGLALGSVAFKGNKGRYSVVSLCETGNSFLGIFAIPLLFTYLSLSTSMNIDAPLSPQEISLWPLMFIGGVSVCLLGFFTGAEMPEFLGLLPYEKGKVLFLNYLGALLSGVFLNFLLSMAYSTEQILFVFMVLSVLTLLMMAIESKKVFSFILILFPPIFCWLAISLHQRFEYNFLSAYYQGIKVKDFQKAWNLSSVTKKMGRIEVFKSPFQEIHLVTDFPPRESEDKGNITLYLNYRPQFDLHSYITYHESMLHGALNLSLKKPENILILGGGDGILLSKVKKALPQSKVTLVELDPLMVKLFKERRNLNHFNNYVFEEKANTLIEDGFYFLKTTQESYDGVFIDFPYPYSDELTGLYSSEFYGVLKSRMKKGAFAIVDFPVTDGLGTSLLYENLKVTLKRAGLRNIFPFGPYSSFVYFEKESSSRQRELNFDYEKLPRHLHLSTSMNLVGLDHLKSHHNIKGREFSLFYDY